MNNCDTDISGDCPVSSLARCELKTSPELCALNRQKPQSPSLRSRLNNDRSFRSEKSAIPSTDSKARNRKPASDAKIRPQVSFDRPSGTETLFASFPGPSFRRAKVLPQSLHRVTYYRRSSRLRTLLDSKFPLSLPPQDNLPKMFSCLELAKGLSRFAPWKNRTNDWI